MKYVFVALLTFFCLNSVIFSQTECDLIIDDVSQSSDCSISSSDYLNYYRLQNSYVPYNTSNIVEKSIVVSFHIIQYSQNDPKNFQQNNINHTNFLNQVVNDLNYMLANIPAPSKPIISQCGSCHIVDSKIRVNLKNIYYHISQNVWSDNPCSANGFNQFGVDKEKVLNIFLNGAIPNNDGGYPIGGCANLSSINTNVNNRLAMKNVFYAYENDPNFYWGFIKILLHELSHNLGLLHTYLPTCCPESCDETQIDYLIDVFDSGSNQVCHHDLGWGCNVYDSNNSCTNNIMGGTSSMSYYSPLQLGRIHRNLSLQSIRKYGRGYNPNLPFEITSNETWDFSIKMYQDILVKSGNTLTITCEVLMPQNGKIIIEQGAKLIIDGGSITCAYDDALWQGIEVWGNTHLAHTDANQGVLELKNGAIIENATNAVTTWKPNDVAKSGGIIRASNSTFRENKRSVEFRYYPNYTNTSYFDKCTFLGSW